MQRSKWFCLLASLLAANAPASDIGIGYPNVAAAHNALKARSDVIFSVEDGWTRAEDSSAKTVWLFAPKGHPAYPTAVRIRSIEKDGANGTETRVMCRSGKTACEQIADKFHARSAGPAK